MKLLHLLALFLSSFLQPGLAVTEYYIRSNSSAACPTESCLTFNEYVSDTDTYFTSNTSFTFLEGEHYLDSALVINGESDITMKASTNATATIILSVNAVIQFQHSQAFVLNSITIYHHGSDFDESALKILDSHNMQLTNIKFEKIMNVRISRAVHMYNSTARITDCSFFNNSGGAIYVVAGSTVEFHGYANFTGNLAASGGAIAAYESTLSIDGIMIFNNNSAGHGGAIYILLSDLQLLGNTSFENNTATLYGGAISAWNSNLSFLGYANFSENIATGYEGGAISAWHCNLSIYGNANFASNRAESGGAVHIYNTNLQLFGNTVFEHNFVSLTGGAIHALSSNVRVSDTATYEGGCGARAVCLTTLEVIFLHNTAEFGGAVHMELSNFHLLGNTKFNNNTAKLSGGAIHAVSGSISFAGNTTFTHNTAASRGGGIALEGGANLHFRQSPLQWIFVRNSAEIGGAMFIDDSISLCSDVRPACFFDIDAEAFPLTMDSHLNFTLNSASKSGPMMYGGNLENCQVDVLGESGFQLLERILMDTSPISTTDISSDPLKVCICENGIVANCTTESYSVKVKRGELFNISLIAVGQLNTPVSAEILANSDNIGDVQLDPQFPASNGTCTNVGISLLADEHVSNKTLYLYPDGPCGNSARARIAVEVMLEECPPGFDLSRHSDRCDCEERLMDEGSIMCNINNATISHQGNVWIQPIWNNSTYLGFIWHPNCPLGYCTSSKDPEAIHLNFSTPETSDSLCSKNRHGLLCGACRQNYSLYLHNYSCKLCDHKNISWLLVFAFAGIALIAFLLVLRITVAAGTINGLILYANIVGVNRDIFFPPGVVNEYTYPLTMFLAWLNFDFGIPICFYNGLDAYSYAWLQYLFPVYLWLLIGVIILINKLPIKVGGLFGSNPVAVLATVVLMSYTKLLQSSIVALARTQLDYPGNKTNVWLYDANITYFKGKHIALAVIAILVIAVLILPYTLLLTFGYRLLAFSNRRYCFWFNTFKPFLDPYYAPFNGKMRYWSGFLLVVRGGLYVGFAINALGDPSGNLLAISLVFLVLSAWLGHRIYEKLYVNFLELSFILNVCILSIATYHVRTVNGINQAVVTYLSVGIAFAEFIGIVIFHLYSIIRDKLPCKKKPVKQNDKHGVEQRHHHPPTVEQQQQQPSDARFRDSILDDIEMDTY